MSSSAAWASCWTGHTAATVSAALSLGHGSKALVYCAPGKGLSPCCHNTSSRWLWLWLPALVLLFQTMVVLGYCEALCSHLHSCFAVGGKLAGCNGGRLVCWD